MHSKELTRIITKKITFSYSFLQPIKTSSRAAARLYEDF